MQKSSGINRLRILYVGIAVIFGLFVVRAFYMQIIQHKYYQQRAMATQLKQYEIPAERGSISFEDSEGNPVPAVLSETLYTIYADPTLVKNPDKVARALTLDLGLDEAKIKSGITAADTRYSVIQKKVPEAVKKKVLAHKFAGIGAQDQSYRTYPQGELASQLLGFVDDSGTGRYGVEQALNKQLTGTAGMLKAVTDVNGVPLAANKDNVSVEPKAGDSVVLSIDVGMQQQLETILRQRSEAVKTPLASALIMDIHTGAIKAMANYPTYNPSDLSEITDTSVLNNAAVSHPIEVGSIMKALTVAAALDDGVVSKNTSYYDPSYFMVDGFRIKNVEEDGGAGQKNLYDLLNLSLNTGATWLLMQMGGGEINQQARDTWHMYLTDRYMFGKATGIEQGYEAAGYVPSPEDNGAGINLTYANTAFGQAMTATPLQMAAALSAVLNGGTYYKPHLVAATIHADGTKTVTKPQAVKKNAVKPSVAPALESMLVYSVEHHTFRPGFDQDRYTVGGKTGTAQLALPDGGYSEDDFNGTYLGFVGGDQPEYVICVFTIKPKVNYYAGTAAAMPIFGDLAHMLINNSYVSPKN